MARKGRRRRWTVATCVLVIYFGSYLIVRTRIEPAANLAFFVYARSDTVDTCCYYVFWPLYKIDRRLTGRKRNRDRTPSVMPEGDNGL